jgi:23S rRNA (guanosine2251-2'-O)-methyltransferase
MTQSITFGLHAVLALLEKHPELVDKLYIHQDKSDKQIASILTLATTHHIQVARVDKMVLEQLTKAGNHQGVAAVRKMQKRYHESDLPSLIDEAGDRAFFLILDGIQDPHNLGACLRTADCFGVSAVIIPKDKSVGVTGTVSKVASGALESVPLVEVTNLARAINVIKEAGIFVYGAAGDADHTLYSMNLTGKIAIALGAEGSGLRRLTRELCDGLVSIPMQGVVSSLNVSVATGVFLFEVVRQRQLINYLK